jgi:hypothetical protein
MLGDMIKRLLAASMWLFAALYAGSMLHAIVGVPDLVGPIVGLGTACVIAVTPRRAARALTSLYSQPVVAHEVMSRSA